MAAAIRRRSTGAYVAPTILGVVTFVGLFAAILGDGPYDALSWVALGIPVTVVHSAVTRRATSRHAIAWVPFQGTREVWRLRLVGVAGAVSALVVLAAMIMFAGLVRGVLG